jgi:G:T/U-mismatch repair DNA glycosylase
MFTVSLALVALMVLEIGNAVRGDVVILKKGERLEGIVTPIPGKPDSILLRNYKTRLTIQRDRISSIQEEPDSVDWRRIGDQFFKERRYEEALETYRKSASFDPADTQTAEQIRLAELALQRGATPTSGPAQSIDRLLDEVAQIIERKEYEKAESILLKDAPALLPAAAQQRLILDLKKALYRRWALEMADKLRWNDATKYSEKLLQLGPVDRETYERLTVIWERLPEKTPEMIEAYRARLITEPGDTTTRRKLADKYVEYARSLQLDKADIPDRAKRVDEAYEGALKEFELLSSGPESHRRETSDALTECLTILYSRAEQGGDYDRAIAYYKHLQKYSEKASGEVLLTMEYRRDALKIEPTDVDALTTLALRADKQGLVDLARTDIWNLKNQFPDSASVNRALAMFAARDLADAQGALRTLSFERADAMAGRIALQYSFVPGMAEQAAQIRSQAQVALAAYKRAASEQGKRYRELGDSAYESGLLEYAIQYWDKALTIWPGMDAATRHAISVSRSSAQSGLATLAAERLKLTQIAATSPRASLAQREQRFLDQQRVVLETERIVRRLDDAHTEASLHREMQKQTNALQDTMQKQTNTLQDEMRKQTNTVQDEMQKQTNALRRESYAREFSGGGGTSLRRPFQPEGQRVVAMPWNNTRALQGQAQRKSDAAQLQAEMLRQAQEIARRQATWLESVSGSAVGVKRSK